MSVADDIVRDAERAQVVQEVAEDPTLWSRESLDELVVFAKEDEDTADHVADLFTSGGPRHGLFTAWASKNPRRETLIWWSGPSVVDAAIRRAVKEAVRKFDPARGATFTTYLHGYGFRRVPRYAVQARRRTTRQQAVLDRVLGEIEMEEGMARPRAILYALVARLLDCQPASKAIRLHLVARAVLVEGMTVTAFARSLTERAQVDDAVGLAAAQVGRVTRETASRWLSDARTEMARLALEDDRLERQLVRVALGATDDDAWRELKRRAAERWGEMHQTFPSPPSHRPQ